MKKQNKKGKIMMKIDPVVPEEFYEMDVQDMPEKVIEEWFNKPYIQSRGEGCFAVLCLDGGAWDRPTVKGFYNSIEEAQNSINPIKSLLEKDEKVDENINLKP